MLPAVRILLLLSGSFLYTLTLAAECPTLAECAPLSDYPANTRLPDPFTFLDGRKVATKEDWTCRQKEISHILQCYELGDLPPKPTTVVGTFNDDHTSLTVEITEGPRRISFTAKVRLPVNSNSNFSSNSSSSSDSFPAVIAYGIATVPIPQDAVYIEFHPDPIAYPFANRRGQGHFYTLYGTNHSAGAYMAWAWGLSRLIDALESAPGSRIDTKRLAVTGCSRYGGAVLVAGAFEPRIALTISQESGNGGANCWRLADAFFRTRGPGIPEQPAPWEIVVENTYFSPRFHGGVARNVNGLPYDHHLLLSLIEPRGLLLVQNSGIDWLMPSASYGCAVAARKVLQALGTSNFGFTQVGGHSHCQFPEKQAQDVEAFYDKFLRNKDADTGFFKSDLQPRDNRFVESQWINWTTPNLS